MKLIPYALAAALSISTTSPVVAQTIPKASKASGNSDTDKKSKLDELKLKLFFGAQDIALWIAERQGYFLERDLNVSYTYTPTSKELREELADGTVDLAFAAVDNSVLAYEEQGETTIVMGGDSSMNELIVTSDIKSLSGMKDQTLIVDFPTSAYALQAYDILRNNAGLIENEDYDVVEIGSTEDRYNYMIEKGLEATASMLNPPFSILATQKEPNNPKSLGRAIDLVGMYQASGLFVMQDWLDEEPNRSKLVRFMTAWIKGLRWAMDTSNEQDVLKVLMDKLGISNALAKQTYLALLEPGFGLTPDAKFLVGGFENVLRIRDEIEGGGPFKTETYYDSQYYDESLKLLDSKTSPSAKAAKAGSSSAKAGKSDTDKKKTSSSAKAAKANTPTITTSAKAAKGADEPDVPGKKPDMPGKNPNVPEEKPEVPEDESDEEEEAEVLVSVFIEELAVVLTDMMSAITGFNRKLSSHLRG